MQQFLSSRKDSKFIREDFLSLFKNHRIQSQIQNLYRCGFRRQCFIVGFLHHFLHDPSQMNCFNHLDYQTVGIVQTESY